MGGNIRMVNMGRVILNMSGQSRLSQFTEFSRKIVAAGRNYADHAAELGNAIPPKPLLFMKPPTCYIKNGQAIEIPIGCNNFHHEIELGVIISKKCSRITKDQAMDHVGGYCLALDMTARDFQEYAKAKVGNWPKPSIPHYLLVNSLEKMLFRIQAMLN